MPVPLDVLTALRTAARDNNPRVGLEALYAFGALASEPTGGVRRELRQASVPELAAMVGSSDEAIRAAAVRVIGRVYSAHASDDAVDINVGDAVITALNDQNKLIKLAAMEALGAMRYDRGVEALTRAVRVLRAGRARGRRSRRAGANRASGKHPALYVAARRQVGDRRRRWPSRVWRGRGIRPR